MQRVKRSARAVLRGEDLFQFIVQPAVRARLVGAAESGAPPVTAISGDLLKMVGARDSKLLPVKQYVGLCVRAVLEEEGFALADRGVRVSRDPVFRTGSTYRRVEKTNATASPLLCRFIESLTKAEAQELLELLNNRLR
jgi:hypothetical protein